MREKQQHKETLWSRIARIAWIGCIAAQLALPSIPSARSAPPDSRADKPASATREAAAAPSNNNGRKKLTSEKAGKSYAARWISLQSREQIEDLLAARWDLSTARDLSLENAKVPSVPDEILEQIGLRGKNLETLTIGIGSTSAANGETAPEISDQGMESISRLRNLKKLCIACRCSAKGLTHLTKLPELKTLGLDHLTLASREVFEVVAKMPKIETLGLRWCDFSQPIDAATHKAIASLNGRLKSLDFGEWGETKVHRSMFPAIAEIKSLTWLELGEFTATYEDLRPIRDNLRNLRHIGPNTEATKGIRTVEDAMRKK